MQSKYTLNLQNHKMYDTWINNRHKETGYVFTWPTYKVQKVNNPLVMFAVGKDTVVWFSAVTFEQLSHDQRRLMCAKWRSKLYSLPLARWDKIRHWRRLASCRKPPYTSQERKTSPLGGFPISNTFFLRGIGRNIMLNCKYRRGKTRALFLLSASTARWHVSSRFACQSFGHNKPDGTGVSSAQRILAKVLYLFNFLVLRCRVRRFRADSINEIRG